MILAACLVVILAACLVSRVVEVVLDVLGLDATEVLLFLGLAEHELPAAARRR